MKATHAVIALAALAQETRLAVFRLLVEAGPIGLNAGEIGERLGVPANTLSFHLKTLQQAGLLKSQPKGRFIFYAADFSAMDDLIAYLTENCCQGAEQTCLPKTSAATAIEKRRLISSATKGTSMNERPFNVLFLCTGNSARSILSEALLNAMGQGKFRAFSAGSHPTGKVNPFAIELLQKNRLPVAELRSKHWDEFAQPDAPELDFVFTVCDNAAGEVCPIWPGQPMTAHWGVPDPAAVEGDDNAKRKAFFVAYTQLQNRIALFVNLPLTKLDKLTLKKRLEEIGKA